MNRCLQLAAKGLGNTAPNPLVGSVIVYNDTIIGEGYHMQYGQAHAEVNAINSVENKDLLKLATLYVNLEPCAHFGKTPPCADLIIKNQIPTVVIGTPDINSLVNGTGIERLRAAGINVTTRILEDECYKLNKRFFTFHKLKRPYIILKWAQTHDGFIDNLRGENEDNLPLQISNAESKKLLHLWRSQEQAIMVGSNTALLDNPKLTVREVTGKNPIRITIDKWNRIPKNYFLFDKTVPTIVFTSETILPEHNLEYIKIDFDSNIIAQVLHQLYLRNIQSLILEGGALLLNSFIHDGNWDEARLFISSQVINKGVKAPELNREPTTIENINGDTLLTINR